MEADLHSFQKPFLFKRSLDAAPDLAAQVALGITQSPSLLSDVPSPYVTGSFASAKALADHVRAAHTSQHIRGRRTPNPAPAPSGAASELKPDALYYIQDIDGLQYLARLISVIDDHTLHVRWTAQEHTCIVPAHFVVSQVDVIVGYAV